MSRSNPAAFEPGRLPLGELEEVFPTFRGHPQDVVVDVGDVLGVGHLGAQVPEVPHQDVEVDVGEGVPEVGGVVRRDPADVKGHSRLHLDLTERPGDVVVEPHPTKDSFRA
jgi:hypothetical protein